MTAFQAMVGEDPELQQDVLFVTEKSKLLGRSLQVEEYPENLREVFVLPSNWSLESKNAMLNNAVIEYADQSNWDWMYELLKTYKQREGHCNVPSSHKEGEEPLGNWLSQQRQNKKKVGSKFDTVFSML